MGKNNRYRRVVTPTPNRRKGVLTIGGKSFDLSNFTIEQPVIDADTYCTDDFPAIKKTSFTMELEGELKSGAFAMSPPEWMPLPEHLYNQVREDFETGELYVDIEGVGRCPVRTSEEPEREYDFDPPKDWTPESDDE